jgi:hypothetical protein
MQVKHLKMEEPETGQNGGELARDEHGVPQRGSVGLPGPHRKRTAAKDLTPRWRGFQIEKRQMVGGPFAASSGGIK